jgi:hypothetical protein
LRATVLDLDRIERDFKGAILNIPLGEVMVSINNLISKNPDRYTYQNVGDYFSEELGIFDSGVRERIENIFTKSGPWIS